MATAALSTKRIQPIPHQAGECQRGRPSLRGGDAARTENRPENQTGGCRLHQTHDG